MRKNLLKARLQNGELALGLVNFSGSPTTIEVMAEAGFDWVTVDTEHACNDVGNLQQLIRAADAAGITPVVRFTAVNRGAIQQVLDVGAGGVMISHVVSREEAVAAVHAAKYPPIGARGACPTIRAAGYDPEDWTEYVAQCNREVLLFVLVEEREGYERIDEILSVPGVDVVFLGNFDLSLSLGIPGESRWDHPILSRALDRVVEVARKHGVYVQVSLGTKFLEDPEYVATVVRRGVDLLGCGSDLLLLMRSCRRVTGMRERMTGERARGVRVTSATRGEG